MKIAVGYDPNAEEYAKEISKFVESLGHEVINYGGDDPIYAYVAFKVSEDVAKGKCDRGLLFCGTGIGMSVAANKVKGAYAACVSNIFQAERASLSNAANIITLGSQVIGLELAKCFVKEYLSLTFDPQSRSGPKVEAIVEYEREQYK